MYDMRELYNASASMGAEDPFEADPDCYQLVGQSYLYLDPLRNLLDVDRELLPIFDYKGSKAGDLGVSVPMALTEEEEDVEDFDTVEDLKGMTLSVTVVVDSAGRLNEKYCRNPQVVYKWIDGVSEHKTVVADSNSANPKFYFSKTFLVALDEQTVPWFDGVLVFEVYAMAAEGGGRKGHGNAGQEVEESAERRLRRCEEELERKDKVMEKMKEQLDALGVTVEVFQ
eukprot:GHVS01073395.1.p1 GENE.GHVS01073395.1~~GHVS01073395.1.p1  ORF type:complete len:227 (+),score=53.16 GHVS01073395.1:1583-2263(+)